MKNIFLTLSLLLGLSTTLAWAGDADEILIEANKVAVLDLINAQRVALGLNVLERELILEKQIQVHADDMGEGRIPFGHEGFSVRCQNAREVLKGSKYCGEIVAWGQKTPERVHLAWTNSPGHYARMTDVRYTHAGIGHYITADGKRYWGVLFLRYR